MHPAFAQFNGSGILRHKLFSVGFTTIVFGFRFSVHTGVRERTLDLFGNLNGDYTSHIKTTSLKADNEHEDGLGSYGK
jgi:hypothetical protein